MKKTIIGATALIIATLPALSQDMNTNTALAPVEELVLTQEWDKVFPKSDMIEHKKVTFVNRYGITLAADMYLDKIPFSQIATFYNIWMPAAK